VAALHVDTGAEALVSKREGGLSSSGSMAIYIGVTSLHLIHSWMMAEWSAGMLLMLLMLFCTFVDTLVADHSFIIAMMAEWS
jgi:hypothetical protein